MDLKQVQGDGLWGPSDHRAAVEIVAQSEDQDADDRVERAAVMMIEGQGAGHDAEPEAADRIDRPPPDPVGQQGEQGDREELHRRPQQERVHALPHGIAADLAAVHHSDGHVVRALAAVGVNPADNILVALAELDEPLGLPRYIGVQENEIGAVAFQEVALTGGMAEFRAYDPAFGSQTNADRGGSNIVLGVISETETRREAAFTAAKILFPIGLLSALIKTVLDHYTGPT